MKTYKPLQLSFTHRILEQNRRFFFIASAALGVHLQTGETLLEFDSLKNAFACMGDFPLPDTGMPKPRGEFLVSGSFFSHQPVIQSHVHVRIGQQQKTLQIKGLRQWQHGIISAPAPFIVMPIDYAYAFGGPEYAKNPRGIGYKDNSLPCIESPDSPVLSPGDRPEPAGFSVIDPSWPQRMQFQGTYDRKYLKTCFPGYPEDLDWHYAMCAPKDQWAESYYKGNEEFEIHNMHPEIPLIQGKLPGLYPLCFLMHTLGGNAPELARLDMGLDTIWFFPEKLMALLIWRGMAEVFDDEAEDITHVLLAYEDSAQPPKSYEHYLGAFEKRENSDDGLLNNFNTEDLIPIGAKCAMELLQEMAFADDEESEFSKNMDAKAASLQKMADEKIEEAIAQAEKNMDGVNIPADVGIKISGDGKIPLTEDGKPDLRKLMAQSKEAKPDPDTEALNQQLESILPGLTAGDPKKLQLKNFSFAKIDQIMDTVSGFMEKKEKEAKELMKPELEKAKQQIREQMEQLGADRDAPMPPEAKEKLDEAKKKLEESLKMIDNMDSEEKPKAPLPRMNADEVLAQFSRVSPQVMEAMQHIQSMKAMGVEDENLLKMEKQVQEMMSSQNKEMEEGLRKAEKDFKEVYIMGAHFMEDGLSPHKDSVETVRERFLKAAAGGEDVSGRDWACIDLSGQKLDGLDLSGAFLEQVNFTGASLKGANLKKAILARAILENADLSQTDLEEANVGGVHAKGAGFIGANLKSAKLSKGDFTDADFTQAELEGTECLEIKINGADFSQAHMPSMNFIESEISSTQFSGADMSTSVFYNCDIRDADFTGTILQRCTWADCRLENVVFDRADMTSACFAATEPGKSYLNNVRFVETRMDKCNLQNMEMPYSLLTYASMENANCNGANLTASDLSHAYAKSAQFRKARLSHARMDEINLMEGSLAKAELVGTSLAGANLYGADLLRAVIEDTDFSNSNREATLMQDADE